MKKQLLVYECKKVYERKTRLSLKYLEVNFDHGRKSYRHEFVCNFSGVVLIRVSSFVFRNGLNRIFKIYWTMLVSVNEVSVFAMVVSMSVSVVLCQAKVHAKVFLLRGCTLEG